MKAPPLSSAGHWKPKDNNGSCVIHFSSSSFHQLFALQLLGIALPCVKRETDQKNNQRKDNTLKQNFESNNTVNFEQCIVNAVMDELVLYFEFDI